MELNEEELKLPKEITVEEMEEVSKQAEFKHKQEYPPAESKPKQIRIATAKRKRKIKTTR